MRPAMRPMRITPTLRLAHEVSRPIPNSQPLFSQRLVVVAVALCTLTLVSANTDAAVQQGTEARRRDRTSAFFERSALTRPYRSSSYGASALPFVRCSLCGSGSPTRLRYNFAQAAFLVVGVIIGILTAQQLIAAARGDFLHRRTGTGRFSTFLSTSIPRHLRPARLQHDNDVDALKRH